jgi:hypothetical protein
MKDGGQVRDGGQWRSQGWGTVEKSGMGDRGQVRVWGTGSKQGNGDRDRGQVRVWGRRGHAKDEGQDGSTLTLVNGGAGRKGRMAHQGGEDSTTSGIGEGEQCHIRDAEENRGHIRDEK